DQIEAAVFIVIDPGGAGAQFAVAAEPGLLRDVGEGAVAIVVKKPAPAERGYEEIVEAVVVVIADGYAHAVHFYVEAGFASHIGERAIVIVVVELGCGVLLDVAGPLHAVHEEDGGPAVVIVIDESDAGA